MELEVRVAPRGGAIADGSNNDIDIIATAASLLVTYGSSVNYIQENGGRS